MTTYRLTKRVALTLCIIIGCLSIAHADTDKSIRFDQLPQLAQQTIAQQFKGKQIALVKQETDLLSKSYDVILTDGAKIEFDHRGHWSDIDCETYAVPASLVPAPIRSYVSAHYRNAKIVKIERIRRGYEIELSNKLEITFDKAGKALHIDH